MADAEAQLISEAAGIPLARARELLTAANGDVNTAVEMALLQGSAGGAPGSAAGGAATAPTGYTLSGEPVAAPAPAVSTGGKPVTTGRTTRIATLGGTARPSEDDDKGKKSNNYYTGGEKSGIAVEGAGDGGAKFAAEDLFKRAKREGGEMSHDQYEAMKKKQWGAGYSLGSTEQPEGAPMEPTVKPTEKVVKLTFYEDGFMVDDGPLRPMVDGAATNPEDQSFLDDCNQGVVPRELRSSGVPVNVTLMDKRKEKAPKPKFKAFAGEGYSMGGPAPSAAAAAPVVEPSTLAFSVDPDKPQTSIQIRLADGTQLPSRFNLDHTVNDIRNFIISSRPGASQSFDLMTTFPRKVLEDGGVTVKEAGLDGAVVVQTLR